MNTKKIVILLASALFSITAFAGYSQPAEIVVDAFEDGSGAARGDMATARNALNEFAFIGCGIRTVDYGNAESYSFGFCQAGIEEEVSYTCFTESPALLETIKGLSDYSFITFGWSDDGADNLSCTRVGSSTQSFYLEGGKKIK